MISIILVGRNDNYGGNFEKRLFQTLSYNVDKLEKAKIDYEIIFVEWNPVSTRELLSQKIAGRFEKASCYVVDNGIHRYICTNPYINVYEYHAKNVGARHAKGEHLLITNPNDYFGSDIIGFLSQGRFDNKTLYRTGWIEIEKEGDINNTALKDRWGNDPSPFYCASGDFIFCAKELFDSIGGFREDLTFTRTHKDSVFCLAAFNLTKRAVKIGNVYHIAHGGESYNNSRIDYDFHKVSRIPQAGYGHGDISYETQIGERIYGLKLNKELLNSLSYKSKIPLHPKTPFKYRKFREPVLEFLSKAKKRAIRAVKAKDTNVVDNLVLDDKI